MTLIKLDSSATNGTPQNFTTTFSNFVLEENVDYEIAMISLSMNYSYPNVSQAMETIQLNIVLMVALIFIQ